MLKKGLKAVLQFRDIYIRPQIRISGSIPLNNGSESGSCYFRQ
jgi:hypothetical protein